MARPIACHGSRYAFIVETSMKITRLLRQALDGVRAKAFSKDGHEVKSEQSTAKVGSTASGKPMLQSSRLWL